MADPNVPTRNQIAKIAQGDPELLKALERLFIVAGDITPADVAALTVLIEAAAYDAGVANNKAESYQPNFQKLDYIDFNRVGPHVTLPRRMQWNEDDGTIDVGMNADVVLQVGQEMQYYAKNTSGGTIANGTPVMFTGTVGASGKLTFGKAVADGSVLPEYMMGVATQDIENNAFGYVTSFGLVRGIDTTGTPYSETWNDGDLLYFGATAGTWTNSQPSAPAIHQPMAVVINAGPVGSGSIFVRMQTAPYLQDLTDVSTDAAASGDFLAFDGVAWSPTGRDWGYYKDNWSVEPVTVGTATTPVAGDVYSYILDGITRYRLVPTTYDPTDDAFYAAFSAGVCSDLIVARG